MSSPATSFDTIEQKLNLLRQKKDAWTQVSFKEKLALLRQVGDNVAKYATEWVSTVLRGKQMSEENAGEEWAGGPYSTMACIKGYIMSYEAAAACTHCATGHRDSDSKVHVLTGEAANKPIEFPRPPSIVEVDGQKRAIVYPARFGEKIVFPNTTAEVWMMPGKDATQGSELLEAKRTGKGQVALILGAGNQTSIPILDALHKLYYQNQVCILKHNPAAEFFAPLVEKIMEPFISNDYFHHVTGGADVGQYLVDACDNVHITGSDKTHDAIVWADPKNKTGKPKYNKEITSELGCVTPFIIVPGDWTAAELSYVVQHVVSAIVCNNSFNCNAAKVLVTMKNWSLRDTFLSTIKTELSKIPYRIAWYPGSEARYKSFTERYPQAEPLGNGSTDGNRIPWTFIGDIPQKDGEYALCTEPFCPIISETSIEANDVPQFMSLATDLVNNKIWGNLSCSVFIHPATEALYKADFEKMISNLRYGGIAINAWSGVVYGLGYTTWGAYPGNTLEDIQSGRGFVHNTFLFDHPQKSVVRAPFMLPMGAKFPYFTNHKNAANALKALVEYDHSPSVLGIIRGLWQSFRG